MSRILIVDDDADAGEAMSEVLKHEGFEVSLASNGERALAALRSAEALPAVILLDLMMPVMNGWQFRQAQLKDPYLASVPVIVLTAASVGEGTISQLHPAGFLKKPVAVDTLLDLVGSVCQ
jgi:CheY-like chemotaxis protein